MVVADIIREAPKPPPLHTDEEVRAIGMPDLKPGRPEGDIAEHWLAVWELILWLLHFFGAPAAFYETGSHRIKDRRQALDYLRGLEAMIRRILLIMAGEDTRPLEPWLPRAARGPAKGVTKTGAERHDYSGLPPENLPIRFVAIPPSAAPRATPAPKRAPKPIPAWQLPPKCLTEPLPPELDTRQTRRSHRLLLADHWRSLKERKSWPVFALAARFEALIRVYKDPLPYVMRIRQRIAAEQGRHAQSICDRMLTEPARLSRGMTEALTDMFWETCAAIQRLREHGPPIAGA